MPGLLKETKPKGSKGTLASAPKACGQYESCDLLSGCIHAYIYICIYTYIYIYIYICIGYALPIYSISATVPLARDGGWC